MISAADWPVIAPCILFCTVWKNSTLSGLGRGVINAGGVDVGGLLVRPTLGSTDVLNPPEQFLEIIEAPVRILEALVVENEPFHDEFAELLGGSDPEAGGDGAFDAVADGDDRFEAVGIGAVALPISGISELADLL